MSPNVGCPHTNRGDCPEFHQFSGCFIY